MVEDEQQEDEADLVEELAPALHQEGGGDLAATVQAVLARRDLARADSVLHGGSGGHGVLATDADAVEEEGPGVADDPAVEGGAPGGNEHDEAEEHDDGVLDETPSATDAGGC